MARSRRRGGKSSGTQWVLIVLLTLLLVALVGGLGYLFWSARSKYEPRDQASLCPLSGHGPQTLVLLDTTDPLPAVTQTQVIQKLRDLVAGVPKNGYLELRLLQSDPALSIPVVALCNPGDGSDIDPLIGNPELARQRWETEYSAKVDAALAGAVVGSEQDFSPILEVIQQVAADRLTKAADRVAPSKIIVVSDMIEHTAAYSHYRDGTSKEAYEAVTRGRLVTDLAQAEFEIWMVRRATSKVDIPSLSTFWLTWAEDSNAKVPAKLMPLMGM